MSVNRNKKPVYAPDYYKDFKCIADKCRHSCCIDWEICIDSETYEKYMKLDDISATVTECEDGPCFELCGDGRCPHLNDRGLCNIILSYGEEYLSEICRNHPRFFNHINRVRIEAGLGMVCEEACRLILENENRFSLSVIETYDCEDTNEILFDALPLREHIISIIESDGSFNQAVENLKSEFKLPEFPAVKERINRLLSLEILDCEWEKDLKYMKDKNFHHCFENSCLYSKYYKRLLTYFVYRHIGVADSEKNLRARLAFCIFSVEVIKLLFEENFNSETVCDGDAVPETLIDWIRRYSAEIEYSEDNTDELIFAFESKI